MPAENNISHVDGLRLYHRWRYLKDSVTRYIVSAGGISVLLAIALIGFYLLSVIIQMFRGAEITPVLDYAAPGGYAQTILYALEEQREIGLRLTQDKIASFFALKDGALVKQLQLPLSAEDSITAVAKGDPSQRALAIGTADGHALLFQRDYQISYPQDVRQITPRLLYPFGEAPLALTNDAAAILQMAVQMDAERATIAGLTETGDIYLLALEKETALLDDSETIQMTRAQLSMPDAAVIGLAMSVLQKELYVMDAAGYINYFDISDISNPRLGQRVRAVATGQEISSYALLSGGESLLIGDSRGVITQWFLVRDSKNNYTMEQIRSFHSQSSPIVRIVPEYFRKGFVAVAADGSLGLYHATAHRTIKIIQTKGSLQRPIMAIAPRADGLLLEDDKQRLSLWHIDNEYPEISWQSLWGKVWYEWRQQPEYIWQSSASNSDFEPKFSLTPLVFGTFKAAFYAMLFAMPLAIMGAIYTAYFAAPKVRRIVKPTIEIMEALPTVILGFLAGLWLAPVVENNMVVVCLLFLTFPFVILLFGWSYTQLPAQLKSQIPKGWESVLLIPVLLLASLLMIWLGPSLEAWLFDGNMPRWITKTTGLGFDQRNSLVVGIAMGFAVIPTIFSISEDAIYSVPKHLTNGSLALGATSWQSLMYVVLASASPGIFSAVMIGFGRAVGETMIVVMATGNTPIMDMNILEGFRAMSANIAVEMPESEVGSTHYRILFLAAFVLFMVTFILNTLAELVRQRLRVKYSNL